MVRLVDEGKPTLQFYAESSRLFRVAQLQQHRALLEATAPINWTLSPLAVCNGVAIHLVAAEARESWCFDERKESNPRLNVSSMTCRSADDDAQHLSIECLETIRELLINLPTGLLFAGTHELEKNFTPQALELEQVPDHGSTQWRPAQLCIGTAAVLGDSRAVAKVTEGILNL
jgi:hypothetical protein